MTIEWIKHDGASYPVSRVSRPGVRFRDGREVDPCVHPAFSWEEDGCWDWSGPDRDADIVAYTPGDMHPVMTEEDLA